MKRVAWVLVVHVLGCGSDEKPDTGYGGDQPVPPQVTCTSACIRLANCAVHLCDEDTSSSAYSENEDLLVSDCIDTCDATKLSTLEPSKWQCIFTDTCREVFGHDSCGTGAKYSCHQ